MSSTLVEEAEADLKAATTKSMEYHRQVLKEKIEGDSQYVSIYFQRRFDAF